MKNQSRRKLHFYQRKGFLWPVGIAVGLVLVVLLAFRISPWPGTLIIRSVFQEDTAKVTRSLQSHTPPVAITSITNQQYRAGDDDALLDVYFPESIQKTTKTLPVVVWTHGGAWISGDKSNAAVYFQLLAAEGYVVVAPNYSLSPAKTYPTAIHQLNDAHRYIQQNAERFHINTDKIVLAGDSAGSQLSSQLAALATNPSYAREVGITPVLTPEQLKAVILYCGIYKMETLTHPLPNTSKILGWGVDVTVWAYAGTRDFSSPVVAQMSPYYHVTKEFPPAFISGGNADPLTDAQSKPLAEQLRRLGVDVTSLFYAADNQPALPHEYQFNLNNADGTRAFTDTAAFIKARTQ